MVATRLGYLLFGVGLFGLWGLARAATTTHELPPTWSEGYTLVVLEPGSDLHTARRLVQAEGGTVALLLPPRILTAWVDPVLDGQLLGRAGIQSIQRLPGVVGLEGADRATQAAVDFFERALLGDFDKTSSAAPKTDRPRFPDGIQPGPISKSEVEDNLRQQLGFTPGKINTQTSITQNSEYMTGTVSVSLFFVESNGAGPDPDLYDWTESEEGNVFAEAAAGLSWWASQARDHSDCWVAFRLQAYFATQDSRCAQWREPVTRASQEFGTAVGEVLGQFGYASGSHLGRATAFNVVQRNQHQTDWAFCAFVAGNPTGPTTFTDGYAAWSFLGGPYMSLLQRNFGWSFRKVFAHESGHIFRACDEYYTPGYGGCTGCGPCGATGVENGNCEQCEPNPDPCMMHSNAWALCDFTAGQIGWWRTPCAPNEPEPVLAGVAPASLAQGVETDVQLLGRDFVSGMQVDFGSEIEILETETVSDSELRVGVRVALEAVPGMRDLVVASPEGSSDTLIAGLEIRWTPRHYVSPFGNPVFPYDTPETAAAQIDLALGACSSGDSLLVAAGVYTPFEIDKPLTMLGGWDPQFSSRSLPDTETRVEGTSEGPVVRLSGSGPGPTLEGLVLRAGSGALVTTTATGSIPAGGGVLCEGRSPTLRDCRIESNGAASPGSPGAGGGGFFWRSNPVLERCVVGGNHASMGAGLFFAESEATLVDCVLEDNTSSEHGGGLYADQSKLTLLNCRVLRNSAAGRGGGVYAQNDTILGESSLVAWNQAGERGGGVDFSECVATFVNMTLSHNDAGSSGGIHWADAVLPGRITSSIVAWNPSGGIVVSGGSPPELDWNLYWENGGSDLVGLVSGAHDVQLDPVFADPDSFDFQLGPYSLALDSGAPDTLSYDPDGSRNDRGAHGGPRSLRPAPDRVLGLWLQENETSVEIRWLPSAAEDIAYYAVCRDTTAIPSPSTTNEIARVQASEDFFVDPDPLASAWYLVFAVNDRGHASSSSEPVFYTTTTDVTERPHGMALHPAFPNPANPGAWVRYELSARAPVEIAIYTSRGRRVRILASGAQGPGTGRLFWNGRDQSGARVASGVYWIRMVSGSQRFARRLVVLH